MFALVLALTFIVGMFCGACLCVVAAIKLEDAEKGPCKHSLTEDRTMTSTESILHYGE